MYVLGFTYVSCVKYAGLPGSPLLPAAAADSAATAVTSSGRWQA
jgi:hypothetical protein